MKEKSGFFWEIKFAKMDHHQCNMMMIILVRWLTSQMLFVDLSEMTEIVIQRKLSELGLRYAKDTEKNDTGSLHFFKTVNCEIFSSTPHFRRIFQVLCNVSAAWIASTNATWSAGDQKGRRESEVVTFYPLLTWPSQLDCYKAEAGIS